jgi:hypothetical protein
MRSATENKKAAGLSLSWNPYAGAPGTPRKKTTKRPVAPPVHYGPIYNLPETVAYLGLSKSFVQELVRQGKLKRFSPEGRTGGPVSKLLIAQSELDRFIAANHA